MLDYFLVVFLKEHVSCKQHIKITAIKFSGSIFTDFRNTRAI